MGCCGSGELERGNVARRDEQSEDEHQIKVYVNMEWAPGQDMVRIDPSETVFDLKAQLPALLKKKKLEFPDQNLGFDPIIAEALDKNPSWLSALRFTVGGREVQSGAVWGSLGNSVVRVEVGTMDWEKFKEGIRRETGEIDLSDFPDDEVEVLAGMGGILYGVEETDKNRAALEILPASWKRDARFEVMAVLDIKDETGDAKRWRVMVHCLKSTTVKDVKERAGFLLERSRDQLPELYKAESINAGFAGEKKTDGVRISAMVPANADGWDEIARDDQTMGEIVDGDWSEHEENFPPEKYRKSNGAVVPAVLFYATNQPVKPGVFDFWESSLEEIKAVSLVRINNFGFFGFLACEH